jgi:hypothetical protein
MERVWQSVIFWQHEQRQHEQDDLEHALGGIKPGLTRKLLGTGEVGMGAAIQQLQRMVPRQQWSKEQGEQAVEGSSLCMWCNVCSSFSRWCHGSGS